MKDWLAQTDLINQVSKNLMQPQLQNYSLDVYYLRLQKYPHLRLKRKTVRNPFQQQLFTVLIEDHRKKAEYCLVYMHGLGSNTLEGSLLIDHLPQNVSLCCFDFSGSGKSQGNSCTFGIKEHRDIDSIINMLKGQGYTKFILWGRSMGAFASLAYTSISPHKASIALQILDSPFCTFQSVCLQRARNHFRIPEFLVPYSVNVLKQNLSGQPFNPFSLQLTDKVALCSTPTLFVFNQSDEVIPSKNTQDIIRSLSTSCQYEKIIIKDEHNCSRSQGTYSEIFSKIKKYITFQGKMRAASTSKKALEVFSSQIKKIDSYRRFNHSVDHLGLCQKLRAPLVLSCSKQKNISDRKTARKLIISKKSQRDRA